MPLPNFICVGAQKAGTSSLFNILKQSEEVHFAEKKELHFFEKEEEYAKGLDYYKSLFSENYANQKYIGEITPEYLFYSYVPQRIKKDLGEIKIIILLRNPAVRSYSQLNFHKMYQVESLNADFRTELEKDPGHLMVNEYNTWCKPSYYVSKSLYSQQVKRYIDAFGKENVYVGIFEEIFDKKGLNLKGLFDFLGLEPFDYEKKHSNKSVVNKSNTLFNLFSKFKRLVDKIIPQGLSQSVASKLKKSLSKQPEKLEKEEILALNKKYFIEDIKALEKILNKDLSIWYT